jgi:hypothetical protein
LKHSTEIPSSYFSRTLSSVKEQLKREIAVWRYTIKFYHILLNN